MNENHKDTVLNASVTFNSFDSPFRTVECIQSE